MFNIEEHLHTLSAGQLLLRLLLAALAGIIIGLDREVREDKPIDFRAYAIVAVTTAMLAIMGQELPYLYAEAAEDRVTPDVGKIIEGALTGIGFLGAGAIIKVDKKQVIGTATGASIWGAGAIGLAIGFGFYFLAGMAFAILMLSLTGLSVFSRRVRQRR
jgi:putative Mg2+ transporter-C (MgtC) family protein